MCHDHSGFSLLEVLIALAIMVNALLGIVSLQSVALRQVHAADYQNIATVQAAALLERFRADSSSVGLAQEFAQVSRQIPNVLPQGRCDYHCTTTTHACTVSIFWQDHGLQTLTLSTLI